MACNRALACWIAVVVFASACAIVGAVLSGMGVLDPDVGVDKQTLGIVGMTFTGVAIIASAIAPCFQPPPA